MILPQVPEGRRCVDTSRDAKYVLDRHLLRVRVRVRAIGSGEGSD